MFRKIFYSVLLFLSAASAPADSLEQAFLSPSAESKPHTWWHWFAGNISKEGITKDLEAMKEAGIGGLQAFDVSLDIPMGEVRFNTPRWHEMMTHAMAEANRLGLEFGVHNCAGWSATGGTWVTPELAQKQVVWSEMLIEQDGSRPVSIPLEMPRTELGYYNDIRVLAYPTPGRELNGREPWKLSDWKKKTYTYGNAKLTITPSALIRDTRSAPEDAVIDPSSVVDVSAFFDGKRLAISANTLPADGSWTILRMGYTASLAQNSPTQHNNGGGLEIDKLSRAALDLHWDSYIVKLIDDAKKADGVLTNILLDSFEKDYSNWTQGFEEAFEARRSYALDRWLPALTGRVVGDVDRTERFLWDLRKTVGELINENYFTYYKQKCAEHGAYLSVESYGMGNFDELGAALVADMPMGEFWVRPFDPRTPRTASSAANIMGRKYTGAEAFTAHSDTVWTSNPASLKALGDQYFCTGINRFIYHTYVHQPWGDHIKPGMTMGRFGFNLNRNNTWWNDVNAYLSYMARAQAMLQKGRAVKDVLYVYGEKTPNTNEHDADLLPTPVFGHDFDRAGHQVLAMADMEHGQVVFPSGMRYRMIAFRENERMTPQLLVEVERLVDAGAVIFGEPPVSSPGLTDYPNADAVVSGFVKRLWDSGKIHRSAAFNTVLAEKGMLPDVAVPGMENAISYLHKTDGDQDWYFVANHSDSHVTTDMIFRISDKVPELWFPESGRIQTALAWEALDDGRIRVPLRFEPTQSFFVVFRRSAPSGIHASHVSFEPQDRSRFSVESAFYGVHKDESARIDVTDRVRAAFQAQSPLAVSNETFGRDPAFGRPKTLTVHGTVDGERTQLVAEEGRMFFPEKAGESAFRLPTLYTDADSRLHALEAGTLTVRRSDGNVVTKKVDAPEEIRIDRGWTLEFGEFGPSKPVPMKTLSLWNESDDPAIKYFAGTVKYSTLFDLQSVTPNWPCLLHLEKVHVMARLLVNGTNVATLWKPPYYVDIAPYLVKGENRIELVVSNVQKNRLIGDAQHAEPSVERVKVTPHEPGFGVAVIPDWVKNNQINPDPGRHYFTTFDPYDAKTILEPSGIAGSVRLIIPKKFRSSMDLE